MKLWSFRFFMDIWFSSRLSLICGAWDYLCESMACAVINHIHRVCMCIYTRNQQKRREQRSKPDRKERSETGESKAFLQFETKCEMGLICAQWTLPCLSSPRISVYAFFRFFVKTSLLNVRHIKHAFTTQHYLKLLFLFWHNDHCRSKPSCTTNRLGYQWLIVTIAG